jgi:putative colanic acid biosysnthesis UDP-glucose lipid carrier transferase
MPVRKDYRSYEPLLLAFHQWMDALIGAGLLFGISYYYHQDNQIYLELVCFAFFAIFVCFHVLDLYRSWRGLSLIHELHQMSWGCFLVYFLLFLISCILRRTEYFSSPVVLSWMITWPVLLGVQRLILRTVQRHYRTKGYNLQRAVVVGAGEIAQHLAQWIRENPWCGTKVLGFFDDKASSPIEDYPILGRIEALPGYLRDQIDVDRVYIALPLEDALKMKHLLADLKHSTASIFVVSDPEIYDLLVGRAVMYFDGLPVISLRNSPSYGINALLKRIEDCILSGLFLVLASPLMLVIGLAIRLTSGGSVVFKQWRYGLDGRPIKVYKFRTMTCREDGYTCNPATKYDPRVTKIGAFLRRNSLDELPQLINVLQGRMSIVGPRPHPVFLNEEYRRIIPGYMLRHKVKPGMTGLAQINGWRGEIDALEKMERRIEYDLVYLREWSLLLDLKIIVLTFLQGSWRNVD